MNRLENKTALVTGAGRGIGRRCATRLAEEGADIDFESFEKYDVERARVAGDTVVDELEATDTRVVSAEVDVTEPAAVEGFVGRMADELGSIDIVVANAGGGDGPMADTYASTISPEHLRATVERNLYGTVYTCVAAAPYMKEQGSGRVITVASQAGRKVLKGGSYAHYGAAKAAVIMYSEYLAVDLAPHGITVNTLAPGYIGTGKLRSSIDDTAKFEAEIPAGRLGDPDDCADVVAFLASPKADYVTGAVVPVDGGSTIV